MVVIALERYVYDLYKWCTYRRWSFSVIPEKHSPGNKQGNTTCFIALELHVHDA